MPKMRGNRVLDKTAPDVPHRRVRNAQLLVDFLNTPEPSKKKSRVLELLRLCRELRERLSAMRFQHYDGDIEFCPWIFRNEQTRALYHRLQTKLAHVRYRTSPSTGLPFRLDGVMHLDVGREVLKAVPYGPNRVIEETFAVEILLRLADDGSLDHLRQCELRSCGKWFVRKTRKRFCTPAHEKQDKRQSQPAKDRWAAYMRARYWSEKLRALRKKDRRLTGTDKRSKDDRARLRVKITKATEKLRLVEETRKLKRLV